jgi:hypothetical protein
MFFTFRRLLNLDAPGGGGAPAAPAAPAPTAPAAPAAPAPGVSPLQAFIDAKRAEVAAGSGSLFPSQAPAPAPAPELPRNPDGTFAPRPGDPESPYAPEPISDEGDGASQDPSQGDGSTPQETPHVDGEAPADEALRVAIPGRHPNAPDVEIVVDDPEVAERLRQLRNGFMRGEEVRQAQAYVESERAQLDEIATRLQIDPEGFLFEHIPQDRAASVALQIIAQQGVWERVKDIVLSLDDDATRDSVNLRLENERLRRRDSAAEQYQARRSEQHSVEQAKQVIATSIPEHLPEELQLRLYQACQQDVRSYMERTGMRVINPQDVPLLIAGRLREAGIDPLEAMASTRRLPPAPPGTSSAPRPRAAKVTTPTAAEVQRSANARRALSMASPSGTMPSSAPVARPPKGQTLAERIAWARENVKFSAPTT